MLVRKVRIGDPSVHLLYSVFGLVEAYECTFDITKVLLFLLDFVHSIFEIVGLAGDGFLVFWLRRQIVLFVSFAQNDVFQVLYGNVVVLLGHYLHELFSLDLNLFRICWLHKRKPFSHSWLFAFVLQIAELQISSFLFEDELFLYGRKEVDVRFREPLELFLHELLDLQVWLGLRSEGAHDFVSFVFFLNIVLLTSSLDQISMGFLLIRLFDHFQLQIVVEIGQDLQGALWQF